MGTATKVTWDQVVVGSRVRWRGRDYTITSDDPVGWDIQPPEG